MYEKLYEWHTKEIQNYDKKRLAATGEEQKKLKPLKND